MLSRVLLHVIATAGGIDFAANRDAGLQPTWRALDQVQDVASLFLLLHVEDPYTRAVGEAIDLVRCRSSGRRWWDRRRIDPG